MIMAPKLLLVLFMFFTGCTKDVDSYMDHRSKRPTPLTKEPNKPNEPQDSKSSEEILATHPRILLLDGEEDNIWHSIRNNPILENVHEAIMRESNRIIDYPLLERTLDGYRLLAVSNRALHRLFYLSYSFRMTGDEKYFKRAKTEMLAVAGFVDWNPQHFLDVGEMTMAMAIGYDWLYNELSPESREIIREAILKKGIEPSFVDAGYNWWLNSGSNQNQINNAGMVFGALAIYEDYPEIAEEVIERGLSTIKLPMKVYDPDGGYPEGYAYWTYGTGFNVMLFSAINEIWPDRLDFNQFTAFLNTGKYNINMVAPSLVQFNYSEGGLGTAISPAMMWLAKMNNNTSLLWNEINIINSKNINTSRWHRLLPGVMIWGKDICFNSITEPEDKVYVAQGSNPVATLRTSWSDPDAIFLGFKAGSPSVPKGHMDVGSFVLEANGVRWSSDLGSENYARKEAILGMGVGRSEQESVRWKVFRLNNYSHSTLTVDGELQRVNGYAQIDNYSKNPNFSYVISDISDLYSTTLSSLTRGVGIVNKEYVVIRDEIVNNASESVVKWHMMTEANVIITGDNTATLTKDGKILYMRVDSPSSGIKVVTWDSATPRHEVDSPNPGTILLGFEVNVPANAYETLNVKFIPSSSNTETVLNKSLTEW
jgi:hypothetical protein